MRPDLQGTTRGRKKEMAFEKTKHKKKSQPLKRVFKQFKKVIKGPVSRISKYSKLKKQGFVVNFVHEGHAQIKLPKLSVGEVLFGYGITIKRNFDYHTRPHAEVLLRKTIYELYEQGYLSADKSIIDIGSWIADNSLVWARGLTNDAVVFAIDPSPENQAYGKKIAEINNIENIKWIEAVCTEKAGEKLDFDGSLDHASFKAQDNSDRYLVSSTLDQIVNDAKNIAIGLLHVDVEGFELNVLKGASELISRDKPVISFEQHISKEDVGAVSQFLKSHGYRIFMINEVLPGCSLDCRNFLALHSSRDLPVFEEFDQEKGRDMGVFSAVIGPRVIEI